MIAIYGCSTNQEGRRWRRWSILGRFGIDGEVHVMGELRLVSATTTNSHATTAFAAGYRSSIRQRHAVWPPFQPITKAPGAVPY